MKKFAIILFVCVITAIFTGACNNKACPAYAEAETEQAGNIG
ncbi:MAG: hypothetical protein RBS38_00040 [Bacteroidales bacterium]|jgi:hypothetical protein|nr:hypothetical protein [Bacteroidales bacterium]